MYDQIAYNDGLLSIAIEKDLPGTINLVPLDASIKQRHGDYRDMQESMIYGDSVSFDKLIDRMKELINWI